MTKKSEIQRRTTTFHAASASRRVSPRDKPIVALIEFANLLTPRLTAQSKRSHLVVMNQIAAARTAVDNLPRPRQPFTGVFADLWPMDDEYAMRERQIELARANEAENTRARLHELLAPMWTTAVARFPAAPSAFDLFDLYDDQRAARLRNPNPTRVAVPGLPRFTSGSPEDLLPHVWTVRSLLWRLALAQRHPDGRLITIPTGPKLYVQIRHGRLTTPTFDLAGSLIEILKNADLSRLHICGVEYRRTRSRCLRMFFALVTKGSGRQKDCSRECRDLRWHNFDRSLERRAKR